MDMNIALDLEVQKHCPQACVVYDLFHVIAKVGRLGSPSAVDADPLARLVSQRA